MRTTILVLGLTLAASPAFAQTRPFSPALSCSQVQGIVASRGAAVIGTGPGTYDRFVASQAFCQRDEFPYPAFERTADAPLCAIGYRCRANSEVLRDTR